MTARATHRSPSATGAFIVMAALVCCLALTLLAGCGSSKADVISNGLKSDIASIKKGDTQKMQDYFGFDPSAGASELGISSQDFAAQFFKGLDVSVSSVQIDGQSATVQATVTAPDYRAGLANYQQQVTSYLKEHGSTGAADDATRTQAAKLYLAALSGDEAGTVSTDVTLTYQLSDTTWMLQNPQDLADAVFGNAFDGLSSGAASTDTGVRPAGQSTSTGNSQTN